MHTDPYFDKKSSLILEIYFTEKSNPLKHVSSVKSLPEAGRGA